MIDPADYGQATLTVKDVQEILRIGQVSAYALVRSNVFPVVRVGRSYRVPQEAFIRWMQSASAPMNVCAAKTNNTAVADKTCILTKIKNGGYHYGK